MEAPSEERGACVRRAYGDGCDGSDVSSSAGGAASGNTGRTGIVVEAGNVVSFGVGTATVCGSSSWSMAVAGVEGAA